MEEDKDEPKKAGAAEKAEPEKEDKD